MPVVPGLGKLRHSCQEFKVSLGYTQNMVRGIKSTQMKNTHARHIYCIHKRHILEVGTPKCKPLESTEKTGCQSGGLGWRRESAQHLELYITYANMKLCKAQ